MAVKNESDSKENSIVLAMVMLQTIEVFNFGAFKKDLINYYNYNIRDKSDKDDTVTFQVEGETVAIMFMPFPIPEGDIEATSKYAYNWKTAADDLKDHKAHIVISLIWGGNDAKKRFKILTSAVCSILRTHKASGVYVGAQSLLIPKQQYINEVKNRGIDELLLNLWIYFGMRTINEKNYGYTYGLSAFNKKELEILHSEKSLREIREFLYNMAHYVLDADIEFETGQTCGVSENERIKITLSKGYFVKGETFKLAY